MISTVELPRKIKPSFSKKSLISKSSTSFGFLFIIYVYWKELPLFVKDRLSNLIVKLNLNYKHRR